MPISLKEYVSDLKSQKYRASIIHSKNEKQTSAFFKEAAKELKGKYVDLLNVFEKNSILHNALDVFVPERLAVFLKTAAFGEALVFIDKCSFLWDTWSEKEKSDFLILVEKQWNSFYPDTQATLIFNLPTEPFLSDQFIKDTKGNNRIIELTEFSAIV